jgi:hypothetical protein
MDYCNSHKYGRIFNLRSKRYNVIASVIRVVPDRRIEIEIKEIEAPEGHT